MNHLDNWHTGAPASPQMPYNNIMFNTPAMDATQQLTVTKSLKLLRDGFKDEFATSVFVDERMTDLLQQLASEFVETNIPLIDEDHQVELALMLMETLDVSAR